MKSIYSWDAENSVVTATVAETKTIDDVCRVLTKHGPGPIADRFIDMACLITGYEAAEAAWYAVHQTLVDEQAKDEPSADALAGLTAKRDEMEAEYGWLAGYRGEDADDPPPPVYADRAAFIAAHAPALRKAAYGPWEQQLDMQYDDAQDGGTRWVDHVAAVKVAFPSP